MRDLPQFQRIAAYAVIILEQQVLLSRLSPRISREELWTLPGGGLDHGENPRDAVIREIWEETGLRAAVSETAHVYSAHLPGAWRDGRRVDAHAVRIVYDGWVPPGSPEPQVQEVDGSTVAAAWVPISDIVSGAVPVVGMVVDALSDHEPFRLQRLAAYAVITRTVGGVESLLLTRISPLGYHSGSWTLPGGGVRHGEPPSEAVVREVAEECGVKCRVGELLGVHDLHFAGTSPHGRDEDYHGVHLFFAADLPDDTEPTVAEVDGTTDAVAWIPVADIGSGSIAVLDLVHEALRRR